jgi:hypothetical protein
MDLSIPRDVDTVRYNLDAGQRVYVHVAPAAMMGFNDLEVDSTPLLV